MDGNKRGRPPPPPTTHPLEPRTSFNSSSQPKALELHFDEGFFPLTPVPTRARGCQQPPKKATNAPQPFDTRRGLSNQCAAVSTTPYGRPNVPRRRPGAARSYTHFLRTHPETSSSPSPATGLDTDTLSVTNLTERAHPHTTTPIHAPKTRQARGAKGPLPVVPTSHTRPQPAPQTSYFS